MEALKTISKPPPILTGLTIKPKVAEEKSLILKALRARNKEDFRDAVDQFLTTEERSLIEVSEKMSLFPQAVHVFDSVVRRLTLRFAELINWPSSALADVVTSRQKVGRKHDYVVLNLCSRNLEGNVVFRVLNVTRVTAHMPYSAIYALDETKDYWQRVVYLEPVFHEGKAVRSISELKRLVCRPKDPIIAAYLGGGPLNYGYQIPGYVRKQLSGRKRLKDSQSVVFLVAHWD